MFKRSAMVVALLPLLGLPAAVAWAQANAEPEAIAPSSGSLPRVEVRARSATGVLRSPSAIGLDLSWKDTPQSLNILGQQAIEDYRLHSVGDALGSLPGVYVERYETDRSSYFARGFEINNFQIDGLGLLPGRFTGLEDKGDTAMYERIEVLRGAGTLLIGAGNPSATVNYVRKRPGSRFQASSSLSLGSWDERRVDADLSSPLNSSASLRGRLVLMAQGQDSYLDRYRQNKHLGYGVLEADLGQDTVLTVGASKQQRETRGGMWGAVPLVDKDGTSLRFERHVSSAPDWSRWDVGQDELFADLSHSLGGGWQARVTALRLTHTGRAQLLWWSDNPDPAAGHGGKAWPSRYDPDRKESSLDLRLSGPFRAWGGSHELVLGAQTGHSELLELSTVGDTLGTPLPTLAQWHGQFPLPTFDGARSGSDLRDRLQVLYAALRLRPTSGVQLMLGANHTRLETKGKSYDNPQDADASHLAPYLGAVWALTPELSAYASHTALFRPQGELDEQLQRLKPVQGRNDELGLKGAILGGRLNLAAAAFRSQQNHLATYAGQHPVQEAVAIYKGLDTRSQGVELELQAQVLTGLSLNAAYTQLALKNREGEAVRRNTPRRSAQLGAQWQPLPGLRLGAQYAWRSEVRNEQGMRQAGYGLLDLMASYALTPALRLGLNVRNLTDRDYLHFSGFSQGYHGAPRSLAASLSWRV
ncbi:MAG: TonB-dependent siderophore receptor [Roseateles sp.]